MTLPKGLRKKKSLLELKKGNKWINWNPYKSKLSAYILGGGKKWPFTDKKIVLYLGAAEGNTVRFISDICHQGRIIAVDISPIAMAELLLLVEKKKNIIPCLEDAHFPRKYKLHTNKPDIIYQDIAQRDQLDIFLRNYAYYKPNCGLLMLKSRSIQGKENEIFRNCEKKLEENFVFVENIDISKWAKGHRAYYVE